MRVNGAGTKLFESLSDYVGSVRVMIKNKRLSLKIYKLGDWFSIFEKVVIEIVKITRQAGKEDEVR
jgi:hypothetical protein